MNLMYRLHLFFDCCDFFIGEVIKFVNCLINFCVQFLNFRFQAIMFVGILGCLLDFFLQIKHKLGKFGNFGLFFFADFGNRESGKLFYLELAEKFCVGICQKC